MSLWEKLYRGLAFVRRPKWWLGLGGVLAIWAVVGVVRGPEVGTAPVVETLLTQRVVMTGRVRSPARVNLGSMQPGLVKQVHVQEGERVKAGQALVDLDPSEAQAGVDQAKALLEQAKARYAQFKAVTSKLASESLRQAQLGKSIAQKKLERARQLSAAGALTAAELEAAENDASLAESRLASAEAQALSSSAGGNDARLALAAVLQAEAQLRAAQARLEQLALSAPCDGVVLKRLAEPGDVAAAGKVLLVLAKDDAVQITAEPDEKNLALLHTGQPAQVSADAFPSVVIPAKVAWVAPAVDPERGTVEVRLEVLERPDFFRPDMTVSIEVEVAKTQAVVIPSEAIRDAATSHPTAWAVEGGRARQVQLSLGIQGEGGTQVLGGLSPGQTVVSPFLATLKEGQRLRALPAESR